MKKILWVFLGFSLLLSTNLRAAEVHDFHRSLADAYTHYRAATFYLRTGNPAVASFELMDLQTKWQALNKRFKQNPPAIYSRDGTWGPSMQEIELRIDQGVKATENGDLEAAKKKLVPIRQLLSDLRRRNNVSTFSDIVDKANHSFDSLFYYRHNEPDLNKPEQVEDVQRRLSLAAYWYQQCLELAPKKAKNDLLFDRLISTSLESYSKAWVALREKDTRRFINILREISASNRMLYLKFG
ncbi:MAG: hypothetical protein OQJ97_01015 [Rhodospirillales bacterium]|nr:hypothetical protein [Rhodospirillales bacterium]